MVVLIVLVALFLKSNPEDCGCFPDNDKTMTREKVDELNAKRDEYMKTSPWTVRKLLKTKQTWQISIGMGIVMMITVGMLMTMVPTLTMKGLTETQAVAAMSVAAIIGLAASYLWGYIGVKLGTKRACMTVYVVVFGAILFMFIPTTWAAYGVVFCVGCFIGAGNNLCPSLIQEVFGRYDFPAAIVVIMPVWQFIAGNASTVVGVPLSLTDSYTVSYIFLAILAVIGLVMIWKMDTKCIGRNEL
jgi:sugar phosphate permease